MLFKCFSTLRYFVLLFMPSLSLRLLQLSISIGAVDYDDRMVFSLIPSCIVLVFGKINLTWLDLRVASGMVQHRITSCDSFTEHVIFEFLAQR